MTQKTNLIALYLTNKKFSLNHEYKVFCLNAQAEFSFVLLVYT